MDASMLAAFVALALCIPLIGVVVAARLMVFMNLFGRGKGGKDDRPPRGGSRPLGGNPYHLP